MIRRKNSFRSGINRIPAQGIYLVSLGCPKNLVDSEVMAGCLAAGGVPLNLDPETARYYLINTCAFLPSARNESALAIGDGVRWKMRRPDERRLIVAGCLVQHREFAAFRERFPEVDFWSGVDGVPEILANLEKTGGDQHGHGDTPRYLYEATTPRLQLTLPHVAYLKIADGCANRCSYCSIPNLRGTVRSRSMDSVLTEARNLLAGGVREIILIAQDTTAYGYDRSDGANLAGLVRELDRLDGDFQVRILYTHPAHYTDELIDCLAKSRHTLPYLDIPLQHIHDDILRTMGRRCTADGTRKLLDKLRAAIPQLTLRTTFITGLPGEGDAEFAELLEFVRVQRFDRLGVFAYAPEPGTPAAAMPNRVETAVAEARAREILKLQETISLARNQSLLGRTLTVLADETEGRKAIGRSAADAPEIDNSVIFGARKRLEAGKFYQVRITRAEAFDLYGEVC